MILESLDEVMRVLGTNCADCGNFRGEWNAPFWTAYAKDDRAIFVCKHGHEYPTMKTFHTQRKDFDNLSREMIETIRDRISRELLAVDWKKQLDYLTLKARIYASFADPSLKYQFDGFCRSCLNEVPLRVEDRNLWTSCEPCASLMADSSM